MIRFLAAATLIFLACSLIPGLSGPQRAHADTQAELQSQIDAHNAQIKKIEDEIAAYQKTLNVLSSTKQTLQSTIQTIDVSRNQTAAQIAATKKKIDSANLRLRELALEINTKELAIKIDRASVAESLRILAERDDTSMVEQLMSAQDIGSVWKTIDAEIAVSDALRAHATDLANAKRDLDQQHTKVATTKVDLTSLNSNLTTQKQALDANRQAKNSLLVQTKSQESSFQTLIAKKREEQKAFEAELTALENSLKSVGSASIPHAGSGILAWPFTDSFMANCATRSKVFGNPFCVTQYFGNTSFAASGAYNGSGHNGIDVGVPVGTPILAALGGTVMGTGNTDSIPGCYSFGKWVAVKHSNGLATVYAHLSSIKVSAGQEVGAGDAVGFSGMTGYATGPHLHFAVYAVGTPDAPGIQIKTLGAYKGSTTPCANATMPVAPTNAYLNPISYL